MKRFHLTLLALSLALTAMASAQTQGTLIFLRLAGIAGDSGPAYEHNGEITALSVSFGADQAALATQAGGGANAAKAQLTPVTIQKITDKNSPVLFLNCAIGKVIPSARITFRNLGALGQPDFFIVDLSNVLISSYHVDTTTGDTSIGETFALSYTTMKISFTPTMPDGSLAAPIVTGFNVVKNKQDSTPISTAP